MEGGGQSQSGIGLSEPSAGLQAAGQRVGAGPPAANASTLPTLLNAALVTSLLRQSVEVRAQRAAPDSLRHGALSGAHAGGGAVDRAATSQPGSGLSSEARGPGQETGAGPLSEALGELLSEGAGHVGGEGAATALRHGIELLDALRPKPGPMQVVEQTQRPPTDSQRMQGGPAPSQSKDKAKERSA